MQFFIPSLIALLIAAIIVFAILPRLAAPILVGMSLLILGFALYEHITLFKSEYQQSTWQNQLKVYAPFVMIGALLLVVFTYFGMLWSSGTSLPAPSSPNIPALPPANTATNPLTAAVNVGMKAATNIGNTLGNAAGNAAGAVGLANGNIKKNNWNTNWLNTNRNNAGKNRGLFENI